MSQKLVNLMPKVRALMAPHHGRESGIYHDAFSAMENLDFVIISDKHLVHDTQNTVAKYEEYANGIAFRNTQRKVLTTRNDGLITLELNDSGFYIY